MVVETFRGGTTKLIAKNATADVIFDPDSDSRDTMKGGSGDDWFYIEGRDFVTGGAGIDEFVIDPSYEGNLNSKIFDYSKRETIVINNVGPRQDIDIWHTRGGDTIISFALRGQDAPEAQDFLRLVDYTGKVDLEWGF